MDFSSDIGSWLIRTALRLPAILLALTVHEFAHGWVAWLKGDNTARDSGRLSLNPLSHLDPLGTILLLFGPFGWAKPVPVNTMNLDNPRRDLSLVAVAGPASNIALAVLIGLLLRFGIEFQLLSNPYLISFLHVCFIINLGLAFFNMIPVPPLDGSNIVLGLLPPHKVVPWLNAMRIAPTILFGLIIAEWAFHIRIFSAIIDPLWNPYMRFFSALILGQGDLFP